MKNSFLADEIFVALTTFGHPVFYVLLLAVLAVFNVSLAVSLFLALMAIEIVCVAIKLVYRKDRPIIQTREGFFNKIDANSFPSIHSARIALIAMVLSVHYKNLFLTIIFMVLIIVNKL